MSHVNEIIVLDDDEDEEEPPRPSKPKASPRNSSKQTNGEEEKNSSSSTQQQSKADTISAENKTLFNKFVEYCSELTSEHPEVISFLQGRYTKANPSYLTSVEFRNTLGRCLTRVKAKRSKVFVYINELCTALKANSQKRKVSLQTHAVQPSAAVKTETQEECDGEAEDVPVKKTGSKRQIRYLENLLRIYSLEIKKLQEKELSLEELEEEDSSYIQESKLKRKLLRIFEKLCELKDCSSLTGRVIEQRILYRGTRYPEINRRLEKFINCTRDLFPDYGDVLRVVERANDKHSLGLPRKQMQSMAQDAFRELGNKLQDRRHLDMIYNFGCHLTDTYKSVNDPAQQDTSLSRRLRENRNVAMSRLNDVIKKYAELQDDGEEDFKKKTKRGSEKNRQSASEGSEEEEESEDSETDIEEELEQSKEMPDSEEGENEEEEIPADQENEADQKMDMASGEEEDRVKEKEDCDDDNVMEDQEEATEQESSPVSTSSSQDKDSPNTTLESEAEAQLPDSPDLPRSDSPAKAKSDDEHNEEQEACEPTTNTGDQEEENQENSDLVQSFEDEGSNEVKEAEEKLNCKPHIDIKASAGNEESTQKCLVLEMTAPSAEKDSDSSDNEQDCEDVADDPSGEESDAGVAPERSKSPVVQEESCTNVSTEEHCVRRASVDSMEEETLCTETTGNHDDDDPVDDTAATGDLTPSSSPAVEHQDDATKVHTEAADPDSCENKPDCDLSPLGSSNGVHTATPARRTSLNRLKLHKNKATHRDSCKPLKIEKESPPPNRKRKNVPSEDWTENNGLTRYNGKDNEEHTENNRKRAKIDRSYTSFLCSSDSESDSGGEGETPGLMMTCSPRETPVKKVRTARPAERPRELLNKPRKIPIKRAKKSHVSTQCDPEEVIVLSD